MFINLFFQRPAITTGSSRNESVILRRNVGIPPESGTHLHGRLFFHFYCQGQAVALACLITTMMTMIRVLCCLFVSVSNGPGGVAVFFSSAQTHRFAIGSFHNSSFSQQRGWGKKGQPVELAANKKSRAKEGHGISWRIEQEIRYDMAQSDQQRQQGQPKREKGEPNKLH